MAGRNNYSDYEKDGVIYTPGNTANKPRTAKTNPNMKKTGVKRKKKPPKSQVSVFLAATLFTGIVVCIIIVALVFAPIFNGTGEEPAASPPPAETVLPPEIQEELPVIPAPGTPVYITALVKTAANGSIEAYDINTGRSYTLTVDNTSGLFNRFGEDIAFAQIRPGDIADIEFSENNSLVLKFNHSPLADDLRNKSVIIDETLKTIEIDTHKYTYNEQLVMSGITNVSDIKPIDILTARRYKDIIWYMELTQGHGVIEFVNGDGIINGDIEIDNNIKRDLDTFGALELSEGSHHLVIKGDNIEPHVEQITIIRGENLYYDLSEIELIKGELILTVNEKDYTLYINGEEVDPAEPIKLDYDTYAIVIEKTGFHPWQGEAVINSPRRELNVTLEEHILQCEITILTEPSGAEIYIDSAFVGVSPVTVSIVYGTHTLTYRKDGYSPPEQPYVITLNTPRLAEPFYIILQEEEAPFMPEY